MASFVEIIDKKGRNGYNKPAYEAAVSSVNKHYMHAILKHYDVDLSKERLFEVHEAASLLEQQHRLLHRGEIKKISEDVEAGFDKAFLETQTFSRTLLTARSTLLVGKRGIRKKLKKAKKKLKKKLKKAKKKLTKKVKQAKKKMKKAGKKLKKEAKKAGKKFKKGVKKFAKNVYKGAKKIGKFVVKAIKKAYKYILKHSPVHAFLHALIHCKNGVAKCLGKAFKKMGEAFANMLTGGYYEKVIKCIKKRERQGKKNNRAHCIGESLKDLASKALDAAAFIPGVGQIIDAARTGVEVALQIKYQHDQKRKLKKEKKRALEQCKKDDEEMRKAQEEQYAHVRESGRRGSVSVQEAATEKVGAAKYMANVAHRHMGAMHNYKVASEMKAVIRGVEEAAVKGEKIGESKVKKLGKGRWRKGMGKRKRSNKKHKGKTMGRGRKGRKGFFRGGANMAAHGGANMALLEVSHHSQYYCKCKTPTKTETKGKNAIVCDNNKQYFCEDDQTCGTEETMLLHDRKHLCSYPTNLPKHMIYTETKCFWGTRALDDAEDGVPLENIEACDAACVARDDCAGATYDTIENKCMLRGGTGNPIVADCKEGLFGLTRTTKEEKLKVDVLNDLNNERREKAEEQAQKETEKEEEANISEVEDMDADVEKARKKFDQEIANKEKTVAQTVEKESAKMERKMAKAKKKADREIKKLGKKLDKQLKQCEAKAKKDFNKLKKDMGKKAKKMGKKMGRDFEKCMKKFN